MLQQCLFQFLSKLRYLYILFKESTIGIGECSQLFLQIFAALLWWSVQHLKEVTQCTTQILGLVDDKEVMELVASENACILCIKTEHYTDAKNVQPSQGLGGVVIVLCQ